MAVSTLRREGLGTLGRVDVMGVGVDPVSEEEVLRRVSEGLSEGTGGWVVTPNTDIVRKLRRDQEHSELVAEADLVVADGMPIVWASRLQGTPVPERVAGSDLIWSLPGEAERHGASIFLLGGSPGDAEEAAAELVERHPGVEVAGTLCPPMGFEEDRSRLRAIAEEVRASGARIVFVGLGFPKQELLIRELRRVHPEAWYLGVGIAISFVAGTVRRAPKWMQAGGLEWLHRVAQEPGRLFGRYLVKGWPFVLRMLSVAMFRRVALGLGLAGVSAADEPAPQRLEALPGELAH